MIGINIEEFAQERNEALLSLDKKKIKSHMKKYQVRFEPENETVFWAGVHKAIIGINSATSEQKQKSRDWLIAHGFNPFLL